MNILKIFKLILLFILNFGYGKIPFLGIPLGLVSIIADRANFLASLLNKKNLTYLFFSFVFLVFSLLKSFIAYDLSFNSAEIFFIASIFYKILWAPYLGSLCIRLVSVGYEKGFITFQSILVLVAAYNVNLYDLLFIFQTQQAAIVFEEIFGIRSVGLMLYHNEGVIMLALLYVLGLMYRGNIKITISDIIIYSAGLMSRLIFLTLPIYQIFFKWRAFVLVVLVFVGVALVFDIENGPLYQVFEIFVNYSNTGDFHSNSATHISTMQLFPSEFSTLIIGDGKYFEDGLFYMGTDIGVARLLFFGGVPYLILYLFLHLIPIMTEIKKGIPKTMRFKIFIALIIVILANLKGLNPHIWFFFGVQAILIRQRLNS